MPLNVSLVTPSKQVFQMTCDSVNLPGEDGALGVFPGHAPYVGLMGQGVVHTRGSSEKKVLVRGGFVQVIDDQVSILVDEALEPKDIETEQVQRRQTEIEEALKKTSLKLEERDALYRERSWLQACLKNAAL